MLSEWKGKLLSNCSRKELYECIEWLEKKQPMISLKQPPQSRPEPRPPSATQLIVSHRWNATNVRLILQGKYPDDLTIDFTPDQAVIVIQKLAEALNAQAPR